MVMGRQVAVRAVELCWQKHTDQALKCKNWYKSGPLTKELRKAVSRRLCTHIPAIAQYQQARQIVLIEVYFSISTQV